MKRRAEDDSILRKFDVNEWRRRPPAERMIRHATGLYFKDTTWALYKSEATVFPTLSDALRARRKFNLEEIELVTATGRDKSSFDFN